MRMVVEGQGRKSGLRLALLRIDEITVDSWRYLGSLLRTASAGRSKIYILPLDTWEYVSLPLLNFFMHTYILPSPLSYKYHVTGSGIKPEHQDVSHNQSRSRLDILLLPRGFKLPIPSSRLFMRVSDFVHTTPLP